MPPRRPLVATLAALALALLGGCGSTRTPPPSLARVEPPAGTTAVSYLRGRLRFDAPQGWAIESGAAPLVVTLGSGPALISIWRYPRSPLQTLPGTIPALEQAKGAVIAAARARDPSFRVISAAVVIQGSMPGVELDALETIRGQLRRVRSTHFYMGGAEIVVDELAPRNLFHTVDRSVFSPLLHSVHVVG